MKNCIGATEIWYSCVIIWVSLLTKNISRVLKVQTSSRNAQVRKTTYFFVENKLRACRVRILILVDVQSRRDWAREKPAEVKALMTKTRPARPDQAKGGKPWGQILGQSGRLRLKGASCEEGPGKEAYAAVVTRRILGVPIGGGTEFGVDATSRI